MMTQIPTPKPALDALASNSFCRVADARQSDGNAIRLLRDGPGNFPLWLGAIEQAERSVLLENYLIQEDDTGRAFAATLADAARRGVTCRVLYDWFGCRTKTSDQFWRALRDAGVEVRSYNPPQLGNPLQWISRDHRKVLCVDGKLAFTGGLCIGRGWAGDSDRGIPPWRDTGIEIRGPAAAELGLAFADSWTSAGRPIPLEELPVPAETAAAGELALWVIAGHPDSMGLYRLEQLVAEIVERSLWLTDAYFVATTGYVRALTGAARAGVDVRLLVPGSGNLKFVQAISRSAYRPLLEAGVRVFEWNGPMMHAKTAVADGCWSRVGSSNSNLASWITNREMDVAIHDTEFAAEMMAMYEHDLENATEILLQSGSVRAKQGIGAPRGASAQAGAPQRRGASRVLAGAVGLGSVVGATLARHRVLGASESRVISVAGLLMLLLAAMLLLLPRVIAYPAGVVAAWFGATLLLRARRLNQSGRRVGGGGF